MNRVAALIHIKDAEVSVTCNRDNDLLHSEDVRLIRAAALYEAFMKEVGLSTDTPDTKETPYRVAKMFLQELCRGMVDEPPAMTVFPNDKKYDEYVIVKDIPYYSICSHHHVMFYGKVNIAYLPKEKLLGISKFARIVQHFASKPQIQEQMTQEIIDYIINTLDPKSVMVVVKGKHLCMCARGAKAVGSNMVTSAVTRGCDKQEILKLFKE